MTNKHDSPDEARPEASVATSRIRATESAPPWLVSMIVHMLAVILLALLYLDQPKQAGPGISLNTQQVGGGDEGIDLFELGGMKAGAEEEVIVEAEVAQTSLVELVPTDVNLSDYLTSLPSEIDALTAMASGAGSGEGISGTGTGDGGPGTGLGMGEGDANFFGLGGSGRRFVYVFDRSASMNDRIQRYSEGMIVSEITPLEAAKIELIKSLNSLTEELSFQIVFYNHFPIVFGGNQAQTQMFVATDYNKNDAKGFIEAVPGDGTTNHIAALNEALKFEPDVIFLLTDGEYKDDPSSREVRRITSICNRKNVVINVIHLVRKPRPGTSLMDLALRTGGRHMFIELQGLDSVSASEATKRSL